MRIAVIGAGVVGVTTAFELATDGHDVAVFERRATVGSEASFANAGFVAPGYVAPWAAPGMPGKVVRHLLGAHSPVRIHASLDLQTWRWLSSALRACRAPAYQANRRRMHRLAQYSRSRLHDLTQRRHLEYERTAGCLVLLRSAKELAVAEAGIAALPALGIVVTTLDADACRAREPGLNPQTLLHAGLFTADDEIANCRQFTHLMRREAETLGVRFRFGADVQRIELGVKPTVHYDAMAGETEMPTPSALPSMVPTSVPPDDWARPSTVDLPGLREESFDAVVICAAMGAPALLRQLGVELPLQAVFGYSLTGPLRHDDHQLHREPRAALIDERYKVAISRFGNRVRVAGVAEIGGTVDSMNKRAIATLHKVLHDWFPGAVHLERAQLWKGARPMLPDGPPVLGASGADGVWLNLGHGGSGWALACGSARVVADAVAGRAAEVDLEGLGIERLLR